MKMYLYRILKLITFTAIVLMIGSCEDEDTLPSVAITNMSVTEAYPLETVVLEGSNFNVVQFVFVGNRQAPFQLDGNQMTFEVPEAAAAGANKITLAMANNYRVTTDFTVLVRPNPVINSITPTAAAMGENVTILGVSLDNLKSVSVDEIEATVVSSSANELVFTVPDGLADNALAEIKIITTGGEVTSASQFYVGKNLLLNGELELGDGDDFTNWGKWNGGAGMTATTSADEAYSGRALRTVAVGGDAWRSQFVSDPVPTEIGVEYTLNVWIKADVNSPGNGGNIRFSTNPNAQYSANYDITGEWQQIEWKITANAAETRMVLDLGVIADAIYFVDNITLVATGKSGPQNLLSNSSFEDGLTDWELLNGTVELTSDEAHNGSNSIKVTPAAGNPWDTQFAHVGIPLTYEGTYELRLWAKAAGPDGVMRVSASQWDGNGADYFYGSDIQVTEDWAEYTWEITVGKDLETHKIVLDMGAGSQVLFVDDVTLKEVQ